MKHTSSGSLTRSSLLACATLCAATSSTFAAGTNGVWTSGVSAGNWSDPANWSSGAVADGAGSSANLAAVDLPSGVFAVNLDADRTVGAISFGDTDAVNTPATWSVTGTANLTLDGATPTLTTGVATTIAPIIAGTAGLTKAGTGSLTLAGANSFTGALSVDAGSLTLQNTNAYASGTTIASGATLVTGRNSSFTAGGLGTGTVELRGTLNSTMAAANTLVYDAAAPISVPSGATATLNTPNRFRLNAAVSGAGTLNMSIVSGNTRADFQNSFTGFTGALNITGSGNARLGIVALASGQPNFNANSWGNCSLSLDGVFMQPSSNSTGNTMPIGSLSSTSDAGILGGGSAGRVTYAVGALNLNSTYRGGIGANAALTKNGDGVFTVTHPTGLGYTGNTLVNAGTLLFNGVKAGTGTTTVASAATLGGTGNLAGVATASGGGIVSPGDPAVASGIGNLTFGSLTLNASSVLDIEFGTGNDTATVASGGTLTLAPGALVDVNGFGTDGIYTIINITGAGVSGTPSTALSVINGAPGKTYLFSASGDAVLMTISGTDPNNYWKPDSGGSWNLASNWSKGSIPNGSGAIARIGPGAEGFGGSFSTPFSITMDANRTVGTLAFEDSTSGNVITIDAGTSGSLSFDNGASPSILTTVAGAHVINAPVAVDADDLTVDIGETHSLAITGVLSGTGATIAKNGLGTLVLGGSNTYDGGTLLNAGAIGINSTTSLGNASGSLTFAGGTLRLDAPLSGVTRSYQVSGASNALINTNGNDFAYDGVISPAGGATGGLSKSGGGVLTLSAAQTYTGTTAVSGGGLNFPVGSSASGTSVSSSNGGNLTVMGGSLTASGASTITGAAVNLTSGSLTLTGGLNANTGNPNSNYNINLTGGTFSSSFVTMGRSATIINNPAAGNNNVGLYVNGATATITGPLTLGVSGSNSSVSGRIDSGSLTVGGTVLLQVTSGDRWTVFDVNGGTFTSSDAVTGIQIGSGQIGSSAFLVRNGTATAERIVLTQTAASTEISRLNVTGGSLYVGAGGIVNTSTGTGVIEVLLGGGTLGAKAPWSSSVAATLTGAATIKAADAVGTAQDITLSGSVGGTGSLTKTGAGILTLSGTNTYTGNTTVSAGTLSLGTASLANSSTVDVSATGNATLNLNFTGSDIVASFSIDGVAQATGTWGSPTSTATHKTDRISGDGILNVGASDPFADWIDDFAVGGLTGKNDDPDHDGQTNLDEFALDGNPASSVPSGKVRTRIETVGADQVLVITLPVRDGASFGSSPSKTATVDDIKYTIEGSNNLSLFDQGVTEIAVSAAGMPTPLSSGWSYHTFRLNGAIGGASPRGPKGFLRAKIEDAP